MLSVQLFTLAAPAGTVLGALIGATGAILVAVITTRWTLRNELIRIVATQELERSRLVASREDVVSTELADAVQQLAIKMSTALHSMCWLTWLARTAPDEVTKARLDLYDSEQHETLPEIGGYSTTVAALDRGAYKKIQPLVKDIYGLDEFIGRASLRRLKDRDEMIRRLVYADAATVSLEMQLPEILGDIVSNRVMQPTVPVEVRELMESESGIR